MGFFLIFWGTSAVVGAIIGATQGRPTAGAFWGLFLGPLGWLMIEVAPDSRPECPECRGFTIVGARKCLHCGSALTLPTTAAPNPRPQQPVQQKPPSAEEEEAAAVAFAQAQDCINTGQSQLAGEILKDIVKRFPKTQAALKAQRCPEYPS
jgi:hypothetical protein